MDGLAALSTANAGFERRLRAVDGGDWANETPCDEWDVRALVNHVVGANVRYAMLLGGATTAEVEATRSTDHLGEDAVESFLVTAAAVVDAFRQTDALTRTGHHVTGDRSGSELLAMRVLDVAVHSWDLARAIGADDTLAPDVVAFVQEQAPSIESSRQRGAFAAAVGEAPTEVSPQDRLLRQLGRNPI